MKKLLFFFFFMIYLQVINAQNEFITIWKPSGINPTQVTNVSAPSPSTNSQIWFPGTGINYTIQWEEVNYPQHNGTLSNVTSTGQTLISFGIPLNPNPSQATYRVKVSNGNGIFNQIKFASYTVQPAGTLLWTHHGNSDKLLEISQWGNIQWVSMYSAFSHCQSLQLTAADSPNLSGVTDASYMFYNTASFSGNPSMADWNTSMIKDFSGMFGQFVVPSSDGFNPPISSWNTSSATSFKAMFENRRVFNQNLNSWDTSKVTDMSYMFAGTQAFNQPLNNWDTSNVNNMMWMFHFNTTFNQPLNSWNISKVTNLAHMFHGCTAFNHPLDNWDTSMVTDIGTIFQSAISFNQTLSKWNLPSLTSALVSLTMSGIDCENYSDTLTGWADNPSTANNINLGPLLPLSYSSDVIPKRNILISKGWIFSNDTLGECRKLSTHEHQLNSTASIFPNPAEDYIHLKNIKDVKNYLITDSSGRLIAKDVLTQDNINIQQLSPGNYILQIVAKEKIHSFKFIKK